MAKISCLKVFLIQRRTVSLAAQYFRWEGFILLLSLLLRLWGLDWKPAHFDEGINGWFADQIRIKGFYAYDPTNYHGPLYFYILFAFQTILGRNLWALRLPAVISSVSSVWLAFRFDRFFGKQAACLAGLTLAVSPAAVFYGRYSIHESSVVLSLMLFTFGLFGLWKIGDRRFLRITIAGGTLLLLLKETAIIHLGCFVLAALLLVFFEKKAFCSIAPQKWSRHDLIEAFLISIGTISFFYSGNFLNWEGLLHLFKTIPAWIHTGMGAGGHEKMEYQCGWFNFYWIVLMIQYEWPSLLGFISACWFFFKKSSLLLRYLSIYALGVLAAYSLIPYKTPWCMISIIWPFAFLFGAGMSKIKWKRFFWSIAGMVLTGSFIFCLRLNFWHYVDFSEPYVYVQTSPEITRVTDPLLTLAKQDPQNLKMHGQIFLESYYPLPWILGDFSNIRYYAQDNPPQMWNGDFILVKASLAPQVEQQLQEPYYQVPFELRDGMETCVGFFKKRIFRSSDFFLNSSKN